MRSGLIGGIKGLFRRKAPPTIPAGAPSVAVADADLHIEYSPHLDGEPDPGEVVWTWVPWEEDPTQGKDRPVVIIGRHGDKLLGVPLTSKQHPHEVSIGAGPWDRSGRRSYAKIERLLLVDPAQVRREGAVLERSHFNDIVAGVRRAHRGP
jgi:PemK-like, MazF-like toxin of type II toxin-antitoxin system